MVRLRQQMRRREFITLLGGTGLSWEESWLGKQQGASGRRAIFET
jgi:hypothetical protein